ncbi:MAG: hypothetical protein RLW61_19210, partial [Gammaproteobacteria bacterium]
VRPGLGPAPWRPAGPPRRAGPAGLFVVALTARTADQALCPAWPWGTHFLWHLCNAAVLGLAISAYARLRRHAPPGGVTAGA